MILIIGRKIRDLFRWPALQLSSDAGSCSNCRRCSAACPMSLDVNLMVRQGIMENSECILYGCCVEVCPENAIGYTFRG
ncbi:4Fe-4S dicluster domain-containing protein [Methanothrix sp.]|uniref:4Fe-4S dicluster domain-containing protein n=1 Tax=Methanothrix sp. TaxID=90426 RepID=UPI00329959B1